MKARSEHYRDLSWLFPKRLCPGCKRELDLGEFRDERMSLMTYCKRCREDHAELRTKRNRQNRQQQ